MVGTVNIVYAIGAIWNLLPLGTNDRLPWPQILNCLGYTLATCHTYACVLSSSQLLMLILKEPSQLLQIQPEQHAFPGKMM